MLDNPGRRWQSKRENGPFGGKKAMNLDETVSRINELARKAKTIGLTDEELEERNELRRIYIEAFRRSVKYQLDSIKYVEDEENNVP
jgi:uncharacterized protein YnzC (UPF0291/DUF896 family)